MRESRTIDAPAARSWGREIAPGTGSIPVRSTSWVGSRVTRTPQRRRTSSRSVSRREKTHDPENLCLMCRQHNACEAALDFGTQHMERYRPRAAGW